MTEPTPMDAVTLSTDRLIAALSTQASTEMLPQNVDLLLQAYCSQLDPAEA
jgi:hypothetical protein